MLAVVQVERVVVECWESWGRRRAQFVDDFGRCELRPVFIYSFYPPVVSHSAVCVFAREVPDLKVVNLFERSDWVGGLCGDNVATCSNECGDVLPTVFSVNL